MYFGLEIFFFIYTDVSTYLSGIFTHNLSIGVIEQLMQILDSRFCDSIEIC